MKDLLKIQQLKESEGSIQNPARERRQRERESCVYTSTQECVCYLSRSQRTDSKSTEKRSKRMSEKHRMKASSEAAVHDANDGRGGARCYADVNAYMPRSYWDYESLAVTWGSQV